MRRGEGRGGVARTGMVDVGLGGISGGGRDRAVRGVDERARARVQMVRKNLYRQYPATAAVTT